MKPSAIDSLARRILEALPRGLADADQDLRRNVRAALSGTLANMDLVTREEYEIQAKLLARTRQKLDQLERRTAALESRLAPVKKGS